MYVYVYVHVYVSMLRVCVVYMLGVCGVRAESVCGMWYVVVCVVCWVVSLCVWCWCCVCVCWCVCVGVCVWEIAEDAVAPLTNDRRFDHLRAKRSLFLPATARNKQVSSAAVQFEQTANRESQK